MGRRSLLSAFVLSLTLSAAQASSSSQITDRQNDVLFLMGGQPGATFNQLANDIAVVTSDENLRVVSVEGGAAVQNLEDLLYLRNVDMALTTLEAMNYAKASGELGTNARQRLIYIAPLFQNPLQILARGGARTIKDLDGKKVNFNNKGSATAQFVPKIFKTLGVKVQEFYLNQADALEGMRHGELDATICSCPGTVPAFAGVKRDSGLQFVSVPYAKSLRSTYLPGRLEREDYPLLIAKGEDVETISASTVLVAYNWPRNTERFQRTAKFVDAFFSKIDEFHKPPRSELWKSVNLAASIPGWTRSPAAEAWIADYRARAAASGRNNANAPVNTSGVQPTTPQLERMFEDFESWKSRR